MKRKLCIVLLVALLLSLLPASLASCGEKQVPVYRGMTVQTSDFSFAGVAAAGGFLSREMLLSTTEEGHYGCYAGDYVGRVHAIDGENPFSADDAQSKLQSVLQNEFGIIDPSFGVHFGPERPTELTVEEFYVTVHIDNPDNFPIASFVLNGTQCSSDMYEDGSSMEEIVVKATVTHTATSKMISVTIGAIKYMDNGELKDVSMGGNATTEAASGDKGPLVPTVTDMDIGNTAVSFNVNLNESRFTFVKGEMRAFLYDGISIRGVQDVFLGDNAVTFDGLEENTLYQLLIAGYYDDLTGNGFGVHIVYADAFYTAQDVLFDRVEIGEESISFGYQWHSAQGQITALKLYRDGLHIEDLDASATSVDGLLPGTAYKLVAEYTGDDGTESIYLEFTTLAEASAED